MRIVLALFVSLINYSLADAAAVSDAKIQKIVKEYERHLVVKALLNGNLPQPLPQDPGTPYPRPMPPDGGGYDDGDEHCSPYPPSKRDCINTMCNYVGHFDCSDQQDLAELAIACRNVSARCVNLVCARVGRFDCDEMSEIKTVGSICRGITDPSCIEFVCSKLSRFDCDELDELRRVAEQCR